jgi:glycosyltransferase involved in cell wall biosynthesis
VNKFRVLHVVRPATGGMKKHVLSLLAKMNRDLFKPFLACPPGTLEQEASSLGVTVTSIPLGGELSMVDDWTAICRLVSILREHEITIMHAHGAKAGLIGRLGARLAKTPVVFMTAHNFVISDEWPTWKKSFFALAERILARYTDKVITASDALREELIKREKINPAKLVTVYNGIDYDPFRKIWERKAVLRSLGLPPLGRVAGMISRLIPQKGVSYFLKAAASLAGEHQVNFLIVGDGPYRQQFEAEALALGLQHRLVFAGERQDIAAILSAVDVLALPSLTEGGLPFIILEAMAAGCPVVATRVGGIPEIIYDTHNGLLIPAKDYKMLAEAIASLLIDREKAALIGRRGRKFVLDNFIIDNMVQKVENEYENVLARKQLFPKRFFPVVELAAVKKDRRKQK